MTNLQPVSPAQVRAARGLLGWSQQKLADVSGKSRKTVVNFETMIGSAEDETISALKKTLEQAGIQFVNNASGEGVIRSQR